jgi:hypothetical protein
MSENKEQISTNEIITYEAKEINTGIHKNLLQTQEDLCLCLA